MAFQEEKGWTMDADGAGSEAVVQVRLTRYLDREGGQADDVVCVEAPLEIMIDDEPYYMTMRLPGRDVFLALGLCFTEGLISSLEDVKGVNHCPDSVNRVNVYLSGNGHDRGRPPKKRGVIYAGCGICGKELIADICTNLTKSERTVLLPLSEIFAMQKTMESQGAVFDATGGAHIAALFDGSSRLLALAEDVGRHNALDKAIGQILFSRQSGRVKTALLSSRLSYEMVQKAGRMGVEIIAGASAPTSLAIELAAELDITLIGFLRPGRANVYTAGERIVPG